MVDYGGRGRTWRDLEEIVKQDGIVLIKTEKNEIALGKAAVINKDKKEVLIQEYISLKKDEKGNLRLRYIPYTNQHKYEEIHKVPRLAYEELREKLEVEREWESKNPKQIYEFMAITAQTLANRGHKKIADQLAEEAYKALFKHLKETKKENPFKYYKTINKIETELIKRMEQCDCKNKLEVETQEKITRLFSSKIGLDRAKKALKHLKIKSYRERFATEDQEIPIELEELARTEPEHYIKIQKELEKKTKQAIEKIKDIKKAQEKIEFLKYAQRCGVETEEATSKLTEKLNELKKKEKQEHKQKLKEIRKTKEKMG